MKYNDMNDTDRSAQFSETNEPDLCEADKVESAKPISWEDSESKCTCGHPKRSHYVLLDDPGCYHVFGCSCLQYKKEAK